MIHTILKSLFSNRKNKSQTNRWMFILIVFMYCLSTLYWISSVAHFFLTIRVFLLLSEPKSHEFVIHRLYPMFNALITINVSFTFIPIFQAPNSLIVFSVRWCGCVESMGYLSTFPHEDAHCPCRSFWLSFWYVNLFLRQS